MQYQLPAEGIFKKNQFGDSVWYEVACTCSDHDHNHTVCVEANETGEISTVIYTQTTSRFWSASRWQQVWQLFTQGYIKQEVSIIMSQQQTLNYAKILESAVHDIEQFKKNKQ